MFKRQRCYVYLFQSLGTDTDYYRGKGDKLPHDIEDYPHVDLDYAESTMVKLPKHQVTLYYDRRFFTKKAAIEVLNLMDEEDVLSRPL